MVHCWKSDTIFSLGKKIRVSQAQTSFSHDVVVKLAWRSSVSHWSLFHLWNHLSVWWFLFLVVIPFVRLTQSLLMGVSHLLRFVPYLHLHVDLHFCTNFFIWLVFLIFLPFSSFSITTAFPFLSMTLYGFSSKFVANLSLRNLFSNNIKSPCSILVFFALLVLSAYSLLFSFLRASLSFIRTCQSCSETVWLGFSCGILDFNSLPMSSFAGVSPVTPWGVVRYWNRKSSTDDLHSLPSTCEILTVLSSVLLNLSTSPLLSGESGIPRLCSMPRYSRNPANSLDWNEGTIITSQRIWEAMCLKHVLQNSDYFACVCLLHECDLWPTWVIINQN